MKKTLFLSFLFCLLGMSLTFAQETDFNGDADFSEEEFRQKVVSENLPETSCVLKLQK